MKDNKRDVEDFLKDFKLFMDIKGITFEQKEKLEECMGALTLSLDNVKDIIRRLSYSNYVKGPEQDRNYPEHFIFIFYDDVNNTQIYIKLSDSFDGRAKCISFHVAKFKIKKKR
ncbi:MAG: type II toxin-antitoxin system MqsR family toxin [Vulcanibacillus sp.]